MRMAVFSTKPYDQNFMESANREFQHELFFLEPRLTGQTVSLAAGFPAVCIFVNDRADKNTLEQLKKQGTTVLALRSAGFNHVDLSAAHKLGITVVRVPAYSPYAVAEHTLGIILALNRKFHRAYARVREGNFSLDGLLGFDLHGKTAGVIGTGKIGRVVIQILRGFGCKVLAYDPYPHPEVETLGGEYVKLDELFSESDIITLHCPLLPETFHIINEESISKMKNGVMLINTSRGQLIDTRVVIESLKSGKIGSLGLDVYEEEADLFFEDLSGKVIQDDVFARLLTFPNVMITGHQAFFTREAMEAIARTTLQNVRDIEEGKKSSNEVTMDLIKKA